MKHTHVLLAVLLLAPPVALNATDAAARPMLFAAYYCWYHAPTNASEPWLHWTYPASATNALAKKEQREGEPPLNSAARPLAGFYDSSDEAVAEWHVQLAKAAGIDAFLVDWWGEHRGLDQNVDRGIVAAAEKLGFKFALLDERAQFHAKLEDYEAMLARALRKYKDSPAYLKLDGRPVVYLYQVAQKPGLTAEEFPKLKQFVEKEAGPVFWIVDKIAHDGAAAKTGDADREKRIPADWLATPGIDAFGFYSTFSNFRADAYDQLAGKFRYMTKLAHDAGKKMLLPVHPGHDNSHFVNEPYAMPRRDGQTLRDYLRAATDARADFIMVTSWNEWPETTVVEPSSSWPDPYLYLKIIAEWKGSRFIAPPVPMLATSGGEAVPADYDPYGGWKKLQGKKTGFFHIEQLDGKYWFVTPEGNAFISKGVCSVNTDGAEKSQVDREGGARGWAERTAQRLRGWGLNTAGCWTDREVGAAGIVWTPRPHLSDAHGNKLPDVSDPAWAEQVKARAMKECAPLKDDPWVLGYFLDNEIRWTGDEAKAAQYFKVMCEAIRAADPHHLILGCRFAGAPPMSVVREMKGRADVISINNYGRNPPVALLQQMHAETGLPFLVTEFSAKAKDSGPLTAHGSGPVVATQAERARQLEHYVTSLVGLDACVGYHWFRYRDRPGTNQGLVKVNEEPWPEMAEMMKALSPTIEALHARVQPVEKVGSVDARPPQAIDRNREGERPREPSKGRAGELSAGCQSLACD